MTEDIAKGLVRAGVVVVSGMADGIDTQAHKAALDAGGETVAVLGSGIDESVIYPWGNIGLACEIEKHGAVISEFDPYAHAEKFYFPQRNRIISGLSLGVVVILPVVSKPVIGSLNKLLLLFLRSKPVGS